MSSIRLAALAALTAGLLATSAHGATLGFDTLGTGDDLLTNYGGYQWEGWKVLDPVLDPIGGLGYVGAVISPHNVGFNNFGGLTTIRSSSAFTFVGGFFTATHNDGLHFVAQGLRNGVNLFYSDIVLNPAGEPLHAVYNWAGIDQLEFGSYGGVPRDPGTFGIGDHFAVDDITLNRAGGVDQGPPGSAAPEPETWSLMLLGFFGLGAALRARRRSAATA